MKKNIKEFLEETKNKTNENKKLFQRMLESEESFNAIKTGNIDAVVIADKKEFKVFTVRTSDKTYRVLIEKMHEGAVTLNEYGTILYCNSSFADMVNFPLQKVIGSVLKNFIDDSSKEHFVSLLKKGSKKATKGEIYLYRSNSKLLAALMSVKSFMLDNVRVLSIVFTDLTIQNENQEQLKIKARQLEETNIQLLGLNKELAFQNKEKEKKAKELNIITEDLKIQKEELGSANIELNEIAKLLRVQDEKLISINDDLLRLNEGLEKRVLERTRELEDVNKKLINLNLSKDKFLTVISHDLRNPFSALLVSSDLLNSETELHQFKGIQPLVQIIHRTSHRIFKQLNELIEWAQMQSHKLTLKLEKVNLTLAVDQSLVLLKDIAIQKNILLENKVLTDIFVKADNVMLRSILQNLVTNAIKYTPQNGWINVNARQIDKRVEVSVNDTGIGMGVKIMDSIFPDSALATTPGTDNEKGTGIGLMLVKDFVIQNGGSISIESEPGKGTCITFTLAAN